MTLLSDEQIRTFKRDGYLVIKQVLDSTSIKNAMSAYLRIREKCDRGNFPHVIEHHEFIDHNIWGIEHLFHPDVFEKDLFKEIQSSKVLDYTTELLNSDDVFLALNRIHCTRDYSHCGYWHRDGVPNETQHIQSCLFLLPEAGFYLVPGSHLLPTGQKDIIEGSSRKEIPGQVVIPAKAGDLLLFDSSIVHRGSCVGRVKYQRAHVHLRIAEASFSKQISRSDERQWFESEEVLNCANEKWKKMFCNQVDLPETIIPSVQRRELSFSLQRKITQLKNLIVYYGTSFLPENSSFFKKYKGFTPYLRLNKEQKKLFNS